MDVEDVPHVIAGVSQFAARCEDLTCPTHGPYRVNLISYGS